MRSLHDSVGVVFALCAVGAICGCSSRSGSRLLEADLQAAMDQYAADAGDSFRPGSCSATQNLVANRPMSERTQIAFGTPVLSAEPQPTFDQPYLTFALQPGQNSPQSQPSAESGKKTSEPGKSPATSKGSDRPGYWKDDVFKQMGSELYHLGTCDFWLGYRKAFWHWENALVIAGTWGASIAIRETGVDDTVAHRAHHHRQLGGMDETVQIIGHPATHVGIAGALWLGTTLTKDMKDHEVARAMLQALAVNDATVGILKLSTNTSSPDGDRYGWPSGHTSSAFAIAAVANEYYGPWVGIPSLALAGLVGYQRIDSRVHDFSDVVFGGVLGYVIGASIAKENKGEVPELFGMQVVPYVNPDSGATGLALYKSFK